jgi:hypothetical protein
LAGKWETLEQSVPSSRETAHADERSRIRIVHVRSHLTAVPRESIQKLDRPRRLP